MTDIFREVEEEVRRERLEKLWKEYSDYIIAGVALIVIAIAGFELWRVYEQRQTIKASDEYTAAAQLADTGQSALAAEMFAKLAKEAPGGYAAVSRLQEAGTLMGSGNRADGIAVYRQIANGSDPALAAIARIHLGWALADQEPRAQLESDLAPLLQSGSPFASLAQEILAYADYRAGDFRQAIGAYEALARNPNAPPGLKQRATVIAGFLKAGGDNNFGTVPQPVKPAPAPAANSAVPKGPTPK